MRAKIKGIFKRKYGQEEYSDSSIVLNYPTRTLNVGNKKYDLSEKEADLLKILMENKNTTLKKNYLFNAVWGSDSESEMQTLTVHIKWLRDKIEKDPKEPKHIVTVWGVGYRYE